MLCCLYLCASGSVLPMKMQILQRGSPAPDVHHLRPLMMQVSPSTSMRARILVASEDATSGSVMAKQDRISPERSGVSHASCWASVPYRQRTSILPVSGALQLNTSGAKGERPMTSQIWAYSTWLRPAPRVTSGNHKFQRPWDFALALKGSKNPGPPIDRRRQWRRQKQIHWE